MRGKTPTSWMLQGWTEETRSCCWRTLSVKLNQPSWKPRVTRTFSIPSSDVPRYATYRLLVQGVPGGAPAAVAGLAFATSRDVPPKCDPAGAAALRAVLSLSAGPTSGREEGSLRLPPQDS